MSKMIMKMEEMVPLFKLLGDRTRLTIVHLLQIRECCVCELVDVLELSQPAISQHLRRLRDSGIVSEKRRGQWVYYSLNNESKYYLFLTYILDVSSEQPHLIEKLHSTQEC